ncbi:unnamed protein product [Adineta ricciae]|uniref:Uncharacterized protein n=1 Tax=Adineta ricciae TaxID=249248 RepID=A0A813PZA6_ADIRI|nr:unnamed protein product [Adineta ricciae]CAF1626936.1 unnamed protein product [Adineta ricciae]
MYTRKILFVLILLIISIAAQRDKKKLCIHNLVINGTNLITGHRKQLLILSVVNFNNPSSRTQANRFLDLYRELERQHIRDSVVRLMLINEQDAAQYFSGNKFGKIQLFQDNPQDRLVQRLHRQHGETLNNYVFGRCGYLIYTQEHPNSNLDDVSNYQDLLRIITTAVKNKRRCQNLCS